MTKIILEKTYFISSNLFFKKADVCVGIIKYFTKLPGIIYHPCFSDDGDLDLSRITQIAFYGEGYFSC